MSKFVQIAVQPGFHNAEWVDYGGVYALDEDGNVWFWSHYPHDEGKWELIKIPRDGVST